LIWIFICLLWQYAPISRHPCRVLSFTHVLHLSVCLALGFSSSKSDATYAPDATYAQCQGP